MKEFDAFDKELLREASVEVEIQKIRNATSMLFLLSMDTVSNETEPTEKGKSATYPMYYKDKKP